MSRTKKPLDKTSRNPAKKQTHERTFDTPKPANPGISRLTWDRSTSFPAGAASDAPSICSGDTSESDSSLASGQSSSAGMPGFLPDEMSFTQGFSGSSCSDASNALRVSSWKQPSTFHPFKNGSSSMTTLIRTTNQSLNETATLNLLLNSRQ